MPPDEEIKEAYSQEMTGQVEYMVVEGIPFAQFVIDCKRGYEQRPEWFGRENVLPVPRIAKGEIKSYNPLVIKVKRHRKGI